MENKLVIVGMGKEKSYFRLRHILTIYFVVLPAGSYSYVIDYHCLPLHCHRFQFFPQVLYSRRRRRH